MAHQLFSYGPPNYTNDAEIKDILVPSSQDKYGRMNPSLSNPIILLKNTGANDLRQAKIRYGLKNRKKSVYHWSGELKFLEEAEIVLPIPNWQGIKKSQLFEVELKSINGEKDENPLNNRLNSIVPLPKVFPKEFTLQINTNNVDRARENSFTIFDNTGKIHYSGDVFSDSTEYQYPIKLKRGFYTFLFKDDMEDGISVHWWYRNSNPEMIGINGDIKFLDSNGDVLHQFKPDFGQELRFGFFVGKLP